MHQQETNRLEAHRFSGHDELSASVQAHLHWLQTNIDALQRQIDDHIDGHPRLRQDAEPGSAASPAWATSTIRQVPRLYR